MRAKHLLQTLVVTAALCATTIATANASPTTNSPGPPPSQEAKPSCAAEVRHVPAREVVDAAKLQADRDRLAKLDPQGNRELTRFLDTGAAILPVAVKAVDKAGTESSSYGVTNGKEAYVIAHRAPNNAAGAPELELIRIQPQASGGFKSLSVASTAAHAAKIGGCAPNERWQCQQQKATWCFLKHCSGCSHVARWWQALMICAAVACGYAMNYTCCAKGKCVPRMYN